METIKILSRIQLGRFFLMGYSARNSAKLMGNGKLSMKERKAIVGLTKIVKRHQNIY